MSNQILITVSDLTGGYAKEAVVVCGVSFDIRKGEFLGIIGPNGSGKSTLLKLMSRVLHIRKGRVLLEEKDIQHMSLKELSQKIAFVPQETLLNFSFSVEEIVMMGRIPHLRRLQKETKNDRRIVRKSLEATDISELKERNIDELSAGERQRAIIARALAQEPRVIFLDEPTSHLDIGHQIQMLNLLKKLNKEKCLTVLIIMHDLNLAGEYCDRIIMLDKGAIFTQGEPKEVLTCKNIEAVYKTTVAMGQNPLSLKPYVILQTNPGTIGVTGLPKQRR